MRKKNVIIMIISILAFISIVGGVSYSYFIYNKDIVDVSVDTGNMSLSFNNASSSINNISMVPLSDNLGKISNKYIDFTVNGTVDTERIYYEVYIVPKNDSTLSQDNVNNYVKTYLTDQNDVQINNIKLYKNLRASYKNNGKVLYQTIVEPNSNGTQKSETKNFRLRLWIDEGYQSTQEGTFNFSIYLYAMNVDDNFTIPLGGGVEKVKNAINAKINATTNACTPTWTDNNDTPDDESDDVIYFSGTNDCVDMNYVWYSGKLWRITAIYSDGAMKLVTQNNITSIAFNASNQVNFYTDENTTSYMYQWLNEDFYDTLYNASEFIDTTKKWNATMPADTNISTKPAETNMVSANVGLLNSYEYYNSYRCISSAACTGSSSLAGYLNIMYYWWLLNPYDTSNVSRVYIYGYNNGSPSGRNGGRPSIYLKSGLEFTGNGTIDSPYKIVGDKDSGSENDLINTRISGEYVKLVNNDSNQTFRIIGVEDGKTKIIAMDYADNKGTRKFATSTGTANTLWGSGATTGTDTWYTYLNGTYYPNLVSIYGNLFDSSTYYLGTSGGNYKLSVCANNTSGSIKNCIENSQVGTHDTFSIGLPRYGEMFATQQVAYSSSINMWLMNRFSTSSVLSIDRYGLGVNNALTSTYGGRPTLHLKSTVKIIRGTGTESDPYVVGL